MEAIFSREDACPVTFLAAPEATMHPAPLFLAARSTRLRRRLAVAGTLAVVAFGGGAIADSGASAAPASDAAVSSHVIGIGDAGAIVSPGHFGWQRHCPITNR